LAEIWNYLSSLNESAADALMERIHLKLSAALDFPLSGSPRPVLGPKARILVEGQYIILYEPADYGIFVAAVVHHAKKPENWLKDKNS
jgi:plasmid stabilization system protein ParE